MASLGETRDAYDAVAGRYAELLSDLWIEAPLDTAMLDEFAHRVGAHEEPTVLDAGCGAGRVSAYLAERGCRPTGVDLSGEMIRIARTTHPAYRFDVGSLTALPYDDRAFTGALAWYSIIHTPPDGLAAIVAEVRRVLRPAGLTLLSFQVGSGRRRIERAYGCDVVMTAHLHDPGHVASVLGDHGFAVEAQLTRAPGDRERHGQAFVLASLRPDDGRAPGP